MAATTGPLQSTHRTPVHRSPCVEPVLRPRILRRRSDHRRKSHASPGLETGAIQFNSELEGWRPQVAVTSRSQKLKPPNEQRSREEARDGADAHVSPGLGSCAYRCARLTARVSKTDGDLFATRRK